MAEETTNLLVSKGINLPVLKGVWRIISPLPANMELVQSGNIVIGKYCNSKVKGVIEGVLAKEEEDIILSGRWEDELGRGDFCVSIGNSEHDGKNCRADQLSFCGNWKHFGSEKWDGIFEAVRQ